MDANTAYDSSQSDSAHIAQEILAMPAEQVRNMGIFERFEQLDKLGLLSGDDPVAEPVSRPAATWSQQELEAVLRLFKDWPQEEGFQKHLEKFKQAVAKDYIATLEDQPIPLNREQKLRLAAKVFSQHCRDTLGFTDFPEVELLFRAYDSSGSYGGLRPDGRIQICSRNLLTDKVKGSGFSGDTSFVELVLHESTHKLQDYLSERSDLETPNEPTFMRVAQAFYVASDALKERLFDVYRQHPFESQAREVAEQISQQILDLQKRQLSH